MRLLVSDFSKNIFYTTLYSEFLSGYNAKKAEAVLSPAFFTVHVFNNYLAENRYFVVVL
jgi:hypothetical protein